MTATDTVSGGGGTPAYTYLDIQRRALSVAVGATVRLVATSREQNDPAMAGLPAATFASSDVTVALVGNTRLVTGRGSPTGRARSRPA